jgi:hypothetical protein
MAVRGEKAEENCLWKKRSFLQLPSYSGRLWVASGGRMWSHGVTDGLVGLQIASGAVGGFKGSGVANWPWGVAGGLWGLQLTSGAMGDTNYKSNLYYKCPKF